MISGPKTSWSVTQWSILGPVLLNIFNNLADEAQCTLSKFAVDMKLEGVTGTQGYPAATRKDLNSPKKWANRNIMKLSKEKCKVLHLDRNKLMHLCSLSATQLGSSLVEKDLGVLVDPKVNMRQQCALTAKVADGSLCYSEKVLPGA
ncbi:rna-directed dna polymerase from mobile element jockey-like [Willisornis vidua]|uniref:Rna-directed dna polymerase from mobile element jockey-like n=1 Tax=Willisornis vidua TaxID=1566151 RepID=A0ABQ9D8H0_9PASS|nr:rna-directed dna polymerase from mobile element jockey-like [Willisornis vidua]